MRDVFVHPARTVFVVASIAVGVFAVAVMMGGRAVLVRAVDSSFPATVPSTVTYSTTPFDEHLVRSVERQPGVVAVQGRHVAEFRYRVNGGPWNSIMLNAFKNYDDIHVGKLTLSPGSTWPGRNELLVEDASLAYAGLKEGDSIEVETPDHHPVFRVTGTAHDLGAAIPLTSGSVVGYVSWDSLQALEEQPLFNQLDVRGSEAVTSLDQATVFGARLRDRVIEAQGPNVTQMVAHQPNRQSAADLLDGIGLLLVVVGLLTLLLSGFLVVNTISALVSQQVRQIGVMKAIGARSSQIATMFFAITLGYGALALLIAIPLGQLGSNWFVGFLGGRLDYFATYRSIPAPIVATEIALGTLVPLAAAAIPVFLGMRRPVREALYESEGDSKGFGTGVADRLLGRLRGLTRPFSLALRNTFRRKGRLALTLTTLSLAAALFIAVASVRGSILTSVEQISQHRAGEDFVAVMYPAQPLDEVMQAARRVTGVTAAEGWIYRYGIEKRPSGTESPAILVTGLPADTKFFKPEIVEGRWLRSDDSNAIVVDSFMVRDNPNATVGSTIELKIGKLEQGFRVVGIARGDVGVPTAFATRDFLDGALNAGGAVEELQVTTERHDAVFQATTARKLTDAFAVQQIRVIETDTRSQTKTLIRDSLSIIVVFLGILAALLAFVGGIGLSGTMSINVLESTREIGVMRAVGASNKSIYQIFITEGVIVGVASWAIGSVLSFPLSQWLTGALASAVGFPLSFTFSPGGIVLWLALVVAMSVLASLLPAARAARVSVAEAIAYE